LARLHGGEVVVAGEGGEADEAGVVSDERRAALLVAKDGQHVELVPQRAAVLAKVEQLHLALLPLHHKRRGQ
jgi:hypothetical protein